MITINININPYSNRYRGYTIKGRSKASKTQEAYRLGKSCFKELSEKYNSAKLKTDEADLYEVWDIRENKEAQAVMGLFARQCKDLAASNNIDVEVKFISIL